MATKYASFNIAAARAKANLTQRQMAKELGMSESSYIRHEKGQTFFRVDKAIKFAEVCRVPFDQIIFFAGNYTSSV